MLGTVGTQSSFGAFINKKCIQNPDTAAPGEMTEELGNMRNAQTNGP